MGRKRSEGGIQGPSSLSKEGQEEAETPKGKSQAGAQLKEQMVFLIRCQLVAQHNETFISCDCHLQLTSMLCNEMELSPKQFL